MKIIKRLSAVLLFGFFVNASSAMESMDSSPDNDVYTLRPKKDETIEMCKDSLQLYKKSMSIINEQFNNFQLTDDDENNDVNGYIGTERGKTVKAFFDFTKYCYKEIFENVPVFNKKAEDVKWEKDVYKELEDACKAAKTDLVLPFKENDGELVKHEYEILNMIQKNLQHILSIGFFNKFGNLISENDLNRDFNNSIDRIVEGKYTPGNTESLILECFQQRLKKNKDFFNTMILANMFKRDGCREVYKYGYYLLTYLFFGISQDWIQCANMIAEKRMELKSQGHFQSYNDRVMH
jgi:hypothetical protein